MQPVEQYTCNKAGLCRYRVYKSALESKNLMMHMSMMIVQCHQGVHSCDPQGAPGCLKLLLPSSPAPTPIPVPSHPVILHASWAPGMLARMMPLSLRPASRPRSRFHEAHGTQRTQSAAPFLAAPLRERAEGLATARSLKRRRCAACIIPPGVGAEQGPASCRAAASPIALERRALGGLRASTGLRRDRELRREGMPRLQLQL